MARKIIQIAPVVHDDRLKIFALAEDGTLWRKYDSNNNDHTNPRMNWVQLPDLPGQTPAEAAAMKKRWEALGGGPGPEA